MRAMEDAMGIPAYIIITARFISCVKLYGTIEFQLQQHNRERGDLKRTNTRWGVLGILLPIWEAD